MGCVEGDKRVIDRLVAYRSVADSQRGDKAVLTYVM